MIRFLLAAAVALATAGAAHASCAVTTDEEKRDAADVVFEGVALPGKTVGNVLVSPARFRVTRYLKGDGPPRVSVSTALIGDGAGYMSEGIEPGPGQQWRIFASGRAHAVLGTSICSGSGLVEDSRTAAFVPGDSRHNGRYAALAALVSLAALGGFGILRRRAPDAPA